MGCCGNKAGCKKSSDTQSLNAPTPEIMAAGLYTLNLFVSGVKELTAAGLQAGKIFRRLNLQNDTLTQLAKSVADLAVENAYLKSILNLFTPADFKIKDSTLEINFGPQHLYSLTLPVTSHNSRTEIIRRLRAAADKLEAEITKPRQPVNTAQRTFSFVSAE
jgi:hypothetical protein